MKKSILLIAAMFSFAVIFTSCNEVKKEEVKTEKHVSQDVKEVVEAKLAYACPMDCEKGKTYGEAGTCPTCKMDLKAKKGACKKTACAEKKECKPSADCKEKKDCKPSADCKDKKDSKTAASCKDKKECKPSSCDGKEKKLARIKQDCNGCEPGSCDCKA